MRVALPVVSCRSGYAVFKHACYTQACGSHLGEQGLAITKHEFGLGSALA